MRLGRRSGSLAALGRASAVARVHIADDMGNEDDEDEDLLPVFASEPGPSRLAKPAGRAGVPLAWATRGLEATAIGMSGKARVLSSSWSQALFLQRSVSSGADGGATVGQNLNLGRLSNRFQPPVSSRLPANFAQFFAKGVLLTFVKSAIRLKPTRACDPS